MALSSDSISLLFKAKGDTEEAQKSFKDFRKEVKALEDEAKNTKGFEKIAHDVGITSDQFNSLKGSLTVAAGGFALIAAAMAAEVAIAAKVVTGLFSLAKSASDAGSVIKDMQDKTGLAAVTLSTLKLAADNSGSSIEQIGGSLSKFAKLLGEASDGNEKAKATLKELGVDTNDLDGALKETIKSIANAKDGTEQMVLAQKAFGKSGADLIPVIKQMNGDLETAEKEAQRLGVTLTDADVKAADDFGDTLGVLSEQVKVASERFALQFAPQITNAMQQVSEFLARNQDIAIVWGNTIADVLRTALNAWQVTSSAVTGFLDAIGIKFSSSVQQARFWAEAILLAINPVLAIMARVQAIFGKKDSFETHPDAGGQAASVDLPPGGAKVSSGGGRGGGGRSPADEAEDQRKKAVAAAEKEMRDKLELYRATAQEANKIYEKQLADDQITELEYIEKSRALKERTAQFEATLLKRLSQNDSLNAAERLEVERKLAIALVNVRVQELESSIEINKGEKKLVDERVAIDADLTKRLRALTQQRQNAYIASEEKAWDTVIANDQGNLEQQNLLRGDAINAITNLLTIERDRHLADLDVEYKAEKDKIEKEVRDEEEKLKLLDELDKLYKEKALITEEEFQRRKKEIEDQYAVPVGAGDQESGGFLAGVIDGLGTSVDQMMKKVDPIKGLGNIIGSQFNAIAGAVGNAVKAFVLFGSVGGSFRKFAAEMLASIAQMAAVQAVWELAQGFAMLALAYFGHPQAGASATAHFVAAGVYGAIAGVAAIAGRVVAGDSFKQETTGAYGSAGQSGTTSQRTANGGQAYSSNPDEVVEVGRNSPGGIRADVVLTIKDKSDWFAQMFQIEMKKNGVVRQAVLDAT